MKKTTTIPTIPQKYEEKNEQIDFLIFHVAFVTFLRRSPFSGGWWKKPSFMPKWNSNKQFFSSSFFLVIIRVVRSVIICEAMHCTRGGRDTNKQEFKSTKILNPKCRSSAWKKLKTVEGRQNTKWDRRFRIDSICLLFNTFAITRSIHTYTMLSSVMPCHTMLWLWR